MGKLKYCMATNYVHKQLIEGEDCLRTGLYSWLPVMDGEIKQFQDMDAEDYEKYDAIHVNLSGQDLQIPGIIKEKIGNSSSTKIVGNNDYTMELWQGSFDYLPIVRRELSNVDVLFGTEPNQVDTLEVLTGRKIHLIVHPCFVKRLKTLQPKRKQDILSVVSHRYDNYNVMPSLAVKDFGLKTRLIGYDPSSDKKKFVTSTCYNYILQGTNYMDFCFTPGSKVLMSDKSYVNIEDVEELETVFTIDGDKEVIKTMEHEIDEKIFEVKPLGREAFSVTKNHPFKDYNGDFKTLDKLDMLRKDIVKLSKIEKIDLCTQIPKFTNGKYYSISGKSICNRMGSSYVKIPRIIQLNRDLGYFIGSFMSEGSYQGMNKGVQFTLGINDKLDKLPEIFKNIFGFEIKSVNNEKNNTINYYSNSRMIRYIIELFVGGRISYNKYLKPLGFSNKEFVKGFLEAMLQGGGCYNKRSIEIVTTSEVLSKQMCDLFEILKIFPNIYKSKTKGNISHIDGREVKFNSDTYRVVIISPTYYNKVSDILLYGILKEKEVYNNRDNKHVWKDGYVLLPFKKKEIDYSGKVYNIEIEDNNQYTLNSATVHNCEQLMESQVVVDPFTLTSQNRTGWDCAALGVPYVTSDRTYSGQFCYPKTMVPPFNIKKMREMVSKLLKNDKFREDVTSYASEKVEDIGYERSKEKFLNALEEGSPKL